MTTFIEVAMESDDRELRLRNNFGFMMVWSALTIAVFGSLLGSLLETVFAAAGTLNESSELALKIAGDIIVGIVVLIAIVKTYVDGASARRNE